MVLSGRETILRNGEFAGYLTSAGFDYTINKSIGYGYIRNQQGVDQDYILSGKFELEVASERYDCHVHLEPLYDPEMKRIKC